MPSNLLLNIVYDANKTIVLRSVKASSLVQDWWREPSSLPTSGVNLSSLPKFCVLLVGTSCKVLFLLSCDLWLRRIRLIDLKVRCKKKAVVLFVKMIISCALQHEAGHFLVGYSIGVLPKGYMVPSIEAVRQRKFTAARVLWFRVPSRRARSDRWKEKICLKIFSIFSFFSRMDKSDDACIDIKSLATCLRENQIPFFILENLFELAKTREPDKCYDGLSISKLVSPFCDNIWELLLIDKSLFEINFSGAKHFVDLLRLCIEPSNHQLDIETEIMHVPTLPTITELHQAGVKFEVGSNKHLFDIRFDKIKGALEIPKLRISNISIYFKNFQIFETLHCETNHVNDYAIVIGLLVSSPKDAEILFKNGILEHTESIVAASTICGEIGKQAIGSYNRFYYKGLARDLNAYCKSPWRKWNANLKQKYFNTPWASISVIAAVLLLLLTFTQTVCSIIAL
ncbi:hypothetical protein Dsin_023813 [Dipteronia sinensis]|uniref:Uncharacterized protein n=1 Tax=Dipteronia sinensis TaxID=43782 RepID=A0AAE0A409_9ROSI|nr:hypothetical protein Dsin_023813 [Dipteronia sinensis]